MDTSPRHNYILSLVYHHHLSLSILSKTILTLSLLIFATSCLAAVISFTFSSLSRFPRSPALQCTLAIFLHFWFLSIHFSLFSMTIMGFPYFQSIFSALLICLNYSLLPHYPADHTNPFKLFVWLCTILYISSFLFLLSHIFFADLFLFLH